MWVPARGAEEGGMEEEECGREKENEREKKRERKKQGKEGSISNIVLWMSAGFTTNHFMY